MKIVWYFNRLRVMGFQEVAHRIKEQLDLLLLKQQQPKNIIRFSNYNPANFKFCDVASQSLPELIWDREKNKNIAESLLQGDWPALGFPWRWQNNPESWRLSPDTNLLWPQDFFSTIPYRVGNPYGDARVVWEPSRLQQLLNLALLAEEEPCREQAVKLFEEQLLSWWADNPPYSGVHYISAMECGLRLMAVCQATELMKPFLSNKDDVWQTVLGIVESHAELIVKRLSLFSSAGNHTIAECAALIYAGVIFPEFKQAEQWRTVGKNFLGQEASRQFLADGGGVEQAFGYHLLVTDLCHLVVKLLDFYQQEDKELTRLVESGCRFLGELFDPEGNLPHVGDYDGGYALSPFLRISYYSSNKQGLITFPESGYSLIKEMTNGIAVLFDHGPLGMAPNYGHGHSDCLSVLLKHGSEKIFVDVGTYSYTGHPEWRKYFRSAAAHNTVCVDGLDQSKQLSAFMWKDNFIVSEVKVLRHEQVMAVIASHDNYADIGVRHWRAVISDNEGQLLIWDRLENIAGSQSGAHELDLWWHFGGELTQLDDKRFTIGKRLSLVITGANAVTLYHGDESLPSGWASTIYGEKHPIYSLKAVYSGNLPHEFQTLVSPGAKAEPATTGFEEIMRQIKAAVDE
jgi:hypothetical protein